MCLGLKDLQFSFGDLWALLVQTFPPKSRFSLEQIPDLKGHVVVVTGGNTGIGYETIKILLEHDATVYMATRTRSRAEVAVSSLKQETGKEAIFLELNLSSLVSVKRAAEEFLVKEPELHILFNNAAIMVPPVEQVTKDGYDLQWGTNVLGHFYFTELLMPALIAGVATSPDHHTRVITTSSSGAYLSNLKWDTFKDGPARRTTWPPALYFQSKLGNVIVARQVAQRYADKGVISISLNPGNADTDLHTRVMPSLARVLLRITGIITSPRNGALTQLYAGTMPEALNHNGEFMIPWARAGRCKAETYDDELGKRLWQWLDDQVKVHEQLNSEVSGHISL